MHFQFLIEDRSGAELINILMEKIINGREEITFNCKSFKGIGGFTKKNTAHKTKTGCLLNDLATYLRGFNKSLQGFPSAIIVVLDNDTRDPQDFHTELENVASANDITLDHVFCIAVEEMEAWLLGDEAALISAYPSAKRQVLQGYIQDSICGTWEKLADAVYPGGLVKMKKECPTFAEIGKQKREWAKRIGAFMDLDRNQSHSFQIFLNAIQERIPVIAS